MSTTCAACKPIYETLPGWMSDVTKVRKMSDFPGLATANICSGSANWWGGR